MKTPRIQLFALVGGLLTAGPAFGDWQIWTTTETRHVLRSDLPGRTQVVQLAAARNEWESFQILLRSDAPVGAVRARSCPRRLWR